MSDWIPLHQLPRGAVFETRCGTRAVKSEYRYPTGGIECILLASGEYAHFSQGIKDPEEQARAHNATLVRPLAVVSSLRPVEDDGKEAAAMRATIAVHERNAVGALDGGDPETFFGADNSIIEERSALYRLKTLD